MSNQTPLSSDLIAIYHQIDEFFQNTYPNTPENVHLLSRLTKITEELGELTNEIHAKLGFHQVSPHKQDNPDNLAKEWADVFNTVILMGVALNLDLNKTIHDRLLDIKKRYQLE